MHKLTRSYKNIAHLLIKAWFCINCNEFLLTHLFCRPFSHTSRHKTLASYFRVFSVFRGLNYLNDPF